jgi:hypothetical protein
MTAPSPSWSIRRRRPSAALRLVAGLATASAAACAQSPPVGGVVTAAPAPVVHFSTTQRFACRGADSLTTVPFLTWIEEVADRLERALGEPLPAGRGRPMLFVLIRDPASPAARIRRELSSGSAGLGQVVRIANPELAEPADVLAACVSMMVARHVAARQSPGARDASPVTAPDWFACGIAGTLYAVPRLALQRRALDAWSRGADRPLTGLLGPAPPGEPFAPLAEWTTLVAWLRARPGFPGMARQLMQTWADGKAVDPEDLARRLDSAWSARDMAQQWDLAIAAARQIDAPWLLTSADLAARLRAAIRLARDRVPLVLPDDVADPITPAILLARRGEPWSLALARTMLANVDLIPAGRDPALAGAANRYRGVLYALMQPLPRGPAGWFRRYPGGWNLRRSLARADREFDDLEALLAAGLDPNAPPEGAPSAPAGAGAPPRDRSETDAMREIFHDTFRTRDDRR